MQEKTSECLDVQVVLALPDTLYQQMLRVLPGTTARELVLLALDAGLVPASAIIDVEPATAPLGVYGEVVADDYRCMQGDRVEIYRPLQQDPKELRRQRARQSSS